MAKLIIVRHGQSYTNAKAHKNAPNDQNFLTVKGFEDTLAAGAKFATSKQVCEFKHVFCSTYPRTFLTAAAFLSGANHSPIAVEPVADFRERQFGFTEYVPSKLLAEMYSGEEIRGWDDRLDTVPGDPAIGETQQQVYDRVVSAYKQFIEPAQADGSNVLLVCHLYVVKALVSHLVTNSALQMPFVHAKNSTPFLYDTDTKKVAY